MAVLSRIIQVIACSWMLSGCSTLLLGDKPYDRNPREKPVVNITTFSESLECMDSMLASYNVRPVTITAQTIPNLAGDIHTASGAKEMLITSLSNISRKSDKIRFVSFGSDLTDILALHRTHANKDSFQTPDFFIRGAITQIDKNVMSTRAGTGLNQREWNIALSGGKGISYASLDLNVGRISNLQMISGVSSNNVLAVYNRGVGTNIGGMISSVGSFFDFGVDQREGIGQAIRNLVDLGVIELVGQLFDLPYMLCLPIDYTRQDSIAMIEKEFSRYLGDRTKLIKALQFSLKKKQYYNGDIDGVAGRKTLEALAYFGRVNNIATDHIGLDAYTAILYGGESNLSIARVERPERSISFAHHQEQKKQEPAQLLVNLDPVNQRSFKPTTPSIDNDDEDLIRRLWEAYEQ